MVPLSREIVTFVAARIGHSEKMHAFRRLARFADARISSTR